MKREPALSLNALIMIYKRPFQGVFVVKIKVKKEGFREDGRSQLNGRSQGPGCQTDSEGRGSSGVPESQLTENFQHPSPPVGVE